MPATGHNESVPFAFDFAVSYAGEDSKVAEQLAKALTNLGANVYFAPFRQSELLGKRLTREFGANFGLGTRFFVPLVSNHYADKHYPQYEWQIATTEAKKREGEFILPIRLDDTPLVGLPMDVAFLDLRNVTVEEAALRLVSKLPAIQERLPVRWVATFGVAIQDLLETKALPAEAPEDYPGLCNWLTDRLLLGLKAQGVEGASLAEDARNGETLSLRISFYWRNRNEPISLDCPAYWELLELLPFEEVYPTSG